MVNRSKIRRSHEYNTNNIVPEVGTPVPKLQLVKSADNIPLPNETDVSDDPVVFRELPYLKKLTKYIHMDDIILAGLIILLLDEGTEDYYLILILAYLLLADLELLDIFK